jgi:hypothetical protein
MGARTDHGIHLAWELDLRALRRLRCHALVLLLLLLLLALLSLA